MLNGKKRTTICEILTVFDDESLTQKYIYMLMLDGRIGYDNEKLITKESEIYWNGVGK